jgi:hypothetical protein
MVEGISGNAIATLHAGLAQHVDDYVGHESAHSANPDSAPRSQENPKLCSFANIGSEDVKRENR